MKLPANPKINLIDGDRSDHVFLAGAAIGVHLRAVSHPTSLIAIALLVINGHILKSFFPSHLTGKISDAAGLSFYPFLVTAGLSLLSALRIRPRQIAGYLGPLGEQRGIR
jgi:hypothetical protein